MKRGFSLSDQKACRFQQCSKLAGSDNYCPRHSFLVEQFGYEKAVIVELGYPCEACGKRVEDEPKDCPDCDSSRCAQCAIAGRCCASRIAEIESEISSLEDEADDLRARVSALRLHMNMEAA